MEAMPRIRTAEFTWRVEHMANVSASYRSVEHWCRVYCSACLLSTCEDQIHLVRRKAHILVPWVFNKSSLSSGKRHGFGFDHK